MAQSELTIKISANVVQALGGIESVKQKLEQMSKSTMTASERFVDFSAKLSAVSIAFQSVSRIMGIAVSAAKDVITAYSAQEQAERRLQTVLAATQNAVGMSATELYNLADSLSKVTTYSDQEIIAVEQMLAATRRIGRDVLPEATRAVLDMAAATGDDAAGAAKDLAQALADPAGEIESLKEKGIQLTEEQAENIKKVQEQNGVYAAQKILLQEVSKTYGGMAEAIASTDTGKLQQISNVWNDIKEGLGEGLLNAIGPALDWLYERLLDIEEWINDINLSGQIENAVKSANGGTPDFSAYSDTQLIRSINPHQLSSGAYAYDGEQNVVDAVIKELITRGVNFPGADNGLTETMQTVRAWALEMSERNPVGQFLAANANSLISQSDLIRNNLGFKFSETDLMYWNYYQSLLADIESSRTSGLKAPSDISPARAALDEKLGGWQNIVGISNISDTHSVTSDEAINRNPLSDFLEKYGGLSASRQVSGIDDAIRASQSWMAEVDPNSDTYKQLKEINEALYEQRDALLETEDAAASWQDQLTEAIPDIVDNLKSIGSSFSEIMQNMADAAADKLQEIQDKWDEYFDELDRKQERQSESLNAMLASGNISYEDYIDAMNGLDRTREEAQEEARKEEEEQRKKANELGEAAFRANQANQIAQATMDSASAIANIWSEHAGNPVMAGVLTGLAAAAIATQIAAISSQQYTPMAAGGITQGPTRTLLGEGNPHELVMPLTEGNLERFGLGSSGEGGVINITVNIGTAYTGEQLSEDVFRGIERAQRTGALPHWRYA